MLIGIDGVYLVTIVSPDTKERESIRDRPSDTLADGRLSIVGSSDKGISSFRIRISLEVRRKCLLCDGVNTTSDKTTDRSLLIEIEVDHVEVSPHFFHSIVLSLVTDSTIDDDTLVLVFFDKFF